jgi:hypothetical protein
LPWGRPPSPRFSSESRGVPMLATDDYGLRLRPLIAAAVRGARATAHVRPEHGSQRPRDASAACEPLPLDERLRDHRTGGSWRCRRSDRATEAPFIRTTLSTLNHECEGRFGPRDVPARSTGDLRAWAELGVRDSHRLADPPQPLPAGGALSFAARVAFLAPWFLRSRSQEA